MRRSKVVLLAGFAVAAFTSMVAATCGDTTTTVQSDSQQQHGVMVTGQGKVQGSPDVVLISLGVSSLGDTVGDARTQAATSLTAMIDAMKTNGVDEKDIQTSQLSIQPEYDYNDGRQLLRGFRVTNTVTAKLRDINKTSAVVDAAVDAGGDNATINGISFSIDNPEELRSQAREKAVADARARAETLASAGGVSLGDPITINETSYSPPIYDARAALDSAEGAAPAPSTPIEAGELDVVVEVSVTWAIKQ